MPAGYQDLFLEKGTTFTSQLTLSDPNGTPYDLNDFVVSGQARLSPYSSNTAIVFNSSVVDANNGVIEISADSAATANIYAGSVNKLVYDVLITQLSTGYVTRVLEGQIFVSPNVTR